MYRARVICESQTACATVQGHLVHYAEVVFWMYKKGGSGLAGTLPW